MDQRVDASASRGPLAPAISMLPHGDGLPMPPQVLWPERGRADRAAVRFARFAMLFLVLAGAFAGNVIAGQVAGAAPPVAIIEGAEQAGGDLLVDPHAVGVARRGERAARRSGRRHRGGSGWSGR